jgi:hypothetical protein
VQVRVHHPKLVALCHPREEGSGSGGLCPPLNSAAGHRACLRTCPWPTRLSATRGAQSTRQVSESQPKRGKPSAGNWCGNQATHWGFPPCCSPRLEAGGCRSQSLPCVARVTKR